MNEAENNQEEKESRLFNILFAIICAVFLAFSFLGTLVKERFLLWKFGRQIKKKHKKSK